MSFVRYFDEVLKINRHSFKVPSIKHMQYGNEAIDFMLTFYPPFSELLDVLSNDFKVEKSSLILVSIP